MCLDAIFGQAGNLAHETSPHPRNPDLNPAPRGDSIVLHQFFDSIRKLHGPSADLDTLEPEAIAAVERFPIPVLGIGLMNHRDWSSSAHMCAANLATILTATARNMDLSPRVSFAHAIITAYGETLRQDWEDSRSSLLQAIICCGFFSVELAALLEAEQPL